MEFDEYDYLEKTVQNSEPKNGVEKTVKLDDRVRSRSSKDDDDDVDHWFKHSKSRDASSRLRSRSSEREKECSRRIKSSYGRRDSRDRERGMARDLKEPDREIRYSHPFNFYSFSITQK